MEANQTPGDESTDDQTSFAAADATTVVRWDTASKADGGDRTTTDQTRVDFVTDTDFAGKNPEAADDFFRALLTQTYQGVDVSDDDDRSLVAFTLPHWYGNDDDSDGWRRVNGGRFYGDALFLGVVRWDYCEGKNAWAFDRVFPISGDADGWQSPRNRYGTVWCPRSLAPVWTAAHDPATLRETDDLELLSEPLRGDDARPAGSDDRWSLLDAADLDWSKAHAKAVDRARDRLAAGDPSTVLADATADALDGLPDPNAARVAKAHGAFRAEYKEIHGEYPDELTMAAFMRAVGDAMAPGAVD